jgi:hypothetical protein
LTRRPLARLARLLDVDPAAVDRRPPRDAIVASTREAAIRGSEVPKHASEQVALAPRTASSRRCPPCASATNARRIDPHAARRTTAPGRGSPHTAERQRDTRVRQSTSDQTTRGSFDNDPSAGSPTETLLRLLLPPKHAVCVSSRARTDCCQPVRLNPTCSRYVPVGSSDGRCVQRAGT